MYCLYPIYLFWLITPNCHQSVTILIQYDNLLCKNTVENNLPEPES